MTWGSCTALLNSSRWLSYRPSRLRSGVAMAIWCWFAVLNAGCGNTLYVFEVNSAASKLEEARQLGADKLAPYEYYFAKEHLDKARTEAAEADYGDALTLASTSAEYSDKAIRLAREAHRGAGR